jgi:sulfur carrier protein ThiS
MDIHVKLLGFLSQQATGEDHPTGMIVDLPQDATVSDLLDYLNIDSAGDSVVISAGRIIRPQDRLPENSRITIFPVVHGG